MELENKFTLLDFLIFFGTVAFSMFIGVFFAYKNKKKNSVENYFLAGRKLSVLPTALSMVVTYQSSLLVIGGPAEVYAYGLRYTYYFIGGLLSFTFAALTIVPVFHPLKLTSVYVYFKLRYQNNAVRYLVLAFGIIYHVFYMGTVTFGTCVALEVIMGIPQWATILLYTIASAIYTSIGGMKAVIWTDVFQLLIMLTGIFAILIKSTIEVGGPSSVMEKASSRLDMNDFRVDPTVRYQFWNLALGSFTMCLVSCYQQPGIQRINSVPTLDGARRIYVIAGIIYGLFAFLMCYQGVTIFAYYTANGCDPLESGRIDTLNQIIPLAVADLFSSTPGLSGLFIAALSSAVLSTLSSCMSSLGAITYDDIIREIYPDLSETRSTYISKVVVFLYGILAMCFTFIIAKLPGSIINVFYAFMACLDGPTCAVFLVSMMYRKATSKGVFIGALAGVSLTLWLNMGQTFSAVKKTQTLPPGPTDTCWHFLNTSLSTVDYLPTENSSDVVTIMTLINTTIEYGAEDSTPIVEESFSFIQTIFSISYMYFSLIGCIVSIIVSVLISLCTTPPDNVDEKYLFSFRKHILIDLFSRGNSNTSEYKDGSNRNKTEQMELMND